LFADHCPELVREGKSAERREGPKQHAKACVIGLKPTAKDQYWSGEEVGRKNAMAALCA
jgi:hypothetical protein